MNAAPAPVARRAPARTIKALIDGRWYGELEPTDDVRIALRNSRDFRGWVRADRKGNFPAEPGRYHLYVSYACPWAHRTIIYRRLKKLQDVVSMSVVHPRWAGPDGWRFADSAMSTVDHVGDRRNLYEVYQAARPDHTGRVTVPVLWDRKSRTIVNNQSGDIIRIFNSEFDAWGDASVDYYPATLRDDIDTLNAWLLGSICSGVYRVGFAKSQQAYDEEIDRLFNSLDVVDRRLSDRPYLFGDRVTESDWHLFATLCRFDAVYYGALKCNLRPLHDFPALTAFTARLYEFDGIANTVRFDHMKQHYYDAIGSIDPTIVPRGPVVDYLRHVRPEADVAHDTSSMKSAVEFVFEREILSLHRYLEEWMKGEVVEEGTVPARLERALAADFVVIHPTGKRDDKRAVVRNFTAARGEKPAEYALEIRDIAIETLAGGFCLATYTESHRGEAGRTRFCSALLRRRSHRNDVEWLFLHETFTPG